MAKFTMKVKDEKLAAFMKAAGETLLHTQLTLSVLLYQPEVRLSGEMILLPASICQFTTYELVVSPTRD